MENVDATTEEELKIMFRKTKITGIAGDWGDKLAGKQLSEELHKEFREAIRAISNRSEREYFGWRLY